MKIHERTPSKTPHTMSYPPPPRPDPNVTPIAIKGQYVGGRKQAAVDLVILLLAIIACSLIVVYFVSRIL